MTHETFRELVPLYVVGALDGAELSDFERYVAQHRAACEPEIDEFQAVADDLAYAAPPAAPSRAVLHRVMAGIEDEKRGVRVAPAQAPVMPETVRFSALVFRWIPWTAIAVLLVMLTVTIKQMNALTKRFGESQQENRAQQTRIGELETQGAAQAEMIAGQQNTIADLRGRVSAQSQEFLEQVEQARTLNTQQSQEIDTLKNANARLASEKDELLRAVADLKRQIESERVEVASLEKQLHEQGSAATRASQQIAALETRLTEKSETVNLLMDPVLRVAQLAADPKQKSPATGRIYWHAARKEGWIIVKNLDPVPKGSGKSLELWTFCGKQPPVAARVFWTDDSGSGAFPIKLAGDVECVDKFAITLEPTDEVPSPVPTGPIVLAGK
jgi:anti-sigma-K factor RskA